MPSSEAYSVIQDHKGYIWVATDAGISKFDGYIFKTYTNRDGLTDNTVFLLREDNKGRIWCATLTGRICYFSNEKFYALPANDSIMKIVGNKSIVNMEVDNKGILYLGVNDLRPFCVKPPYTKKNIVRPPMGEDSVIHVRKIHNTFFWDASIYKPFSSYNRVVLKNNSLEKHLKMSGKVPAFYRTFSNGKRLVFSFDFKIFRFTGQRFEDSLAMPGHVISLFEDSKGYTWAGTVENGIYIFPPGPLKIDRALHVFEKESVSCIFEDREKGIWLTSLKNGLFYIPYSRVMNFNEKVVPDNNKVYCIAGTGKNILAGKSNGEMLVIDPTRFTYNTVTVHETTRSRNTTIAVLDIKVLNSDTIFVLGNWSEYYNTRNFQKYSSVTYKNNPGLFAKDFVRSSGKYDYMMGTVALFSLKKGSRFVDTSYLIPGVRLNAMTMKEDVLYIGSNRGLYCLENSELSFLGHKNAVLADRIDDIEVLHDGRLIIATKGNGVFCWRPGDKKVKPINLGNGFTDDIACRNIFMENDSISWISTNKGLFKINTVRDRVVFIYTSAHGLPGNEVNEVYVNPAQIWVATSHGISCINRDQSFMNNVPPPVYITGVKVNGVNIPDNQLQNLEIGYNPEDITIDFVGLSYKSMGECKYQYRLLGLHDNWNHTSKNGIEISSLNPGDYTLQVSAISRQGVKSVQPAQIRFTVLAPFWQKAWFIVLMVLVTGALVFLLFRYRLNLVRRREARINELNRALLNLKLKALRAQMNPHFTFNVMNSIQHFILEKDEESAHRYLSKFAKLVRIILQHSEEESISLQEEIKALELYLDLEVMRFENSFDYTIHVDDTVDTLKTMIPSMLMQPYVENSIKHGLPLLKEKGKISIIIQDLGNELKFVIEDNGVGREKTGAQSLMTKEHRSFGTSITQERLSVIGELNNIELTQKTIDLKNDRGEPVGTRVEIYIPKTNIKK